MVGSNSFPLSRSRSLTSRIGNGTQSIAWKINAQTRRESLERTARRAAGQDQPGSDEEGLQIYYGSLHDVLSYPCEVSSTSTGPYDYLRQEIGWRLRTDGSGFSLPPRKRAWATHRERTSSRMG